MVTINYNLVISIDNDYYLYYNVNKLKKGKIKMNVLIACEESQRVCEAFRKKGHRAFSCDVQECSGGHPEWHIKGDVLPLLNGHCVFTTADNKRHIISDKWDLIIAHPPCTYLCVSGNSWFNIEKYGEKAKERYKERYKAIVFFMQIANANCDKIVIENPVGIMSTAYRKPDQIIQPFEYGHPYIKSTCLWLKNVSKLKPTNILQKPKSGWINQSFTKDGRYGGFKNFNGSKERSKTFQGIADAMVEQWG